MKVREVITYKNYFEEFFAAQNQNVRDKIIKILSRLNAFLFNILNLLREQTDFLKSEYN